MDGASLDRLVTLAGIEPDYWDIWGSHHQIDDQAKRGILTALGLPASDEQEVAASIRVLEEKGWHRSLPTVLVVYADEEAEIPISISTEAVDRPVTMRILEEAGQQHEMVFRPGEMPIRGRRRIGRRDLIRLVVSLPHLLPSGYHTVFLAGRPKEMMRLIVAPRRCYLPPSLEGGGRAWGIAAQLYTLKRSGNWGIGDFTDLYELVDVAAELGAALIGLNPLHALFLSRPEKASPYSPSTRLFLNPLYIDVEAVPEVQDCPEAHGIIAAARAELTEYRARREVAYRKVKPIKMAVLEKLYACFRRSHASGGLVEAFERFRRDQGELLRRFAIFETLSEEFADKTWQQWPEPYRRPDSTEVETFAQANAERVGFYEFLQWQADEQLGRAQARALEKGLPVGIYRDLAVGASLDGFDAWADQQVVVQSAKVGCPPDPFNMLGQDWEIPPLHPFVLRERCYEPYIAMLRANMRHAGGLRIDHVMGLKHLFWLPADGTPANGAYVKYPFEELLAILALESQRHRCLVVGEDLGTVPAGFRDRMAEADVLSYRVLYFEKDGDRFKRPEEYPQSALACVATHDLPTVKGFWEGADLKLKRQLNLYPSAEALQKDVEARHSDKTLLLRALAREGVLPRDVDPEDADGSTMSPALMAALHGYLARTPASILLVQLDDLMQENEQINLPGTVDERPNWRRRLPMRVQDVPSTPVMKALASVLAERTTRS